MHIIGNLHLRVGTSTDSQHHINFVCQSAHSLHSQLVSSRVDCAFWSPCDKLKCYWGMLTKCGAIELYCKTSNDLLCVEWDVKLY